MREIDNHHSARGVHPLVTDHMVPGSSVIFWVSGEDAQVGLDDETDDPFRRPFWRWEQLAPEFALLTGTNSISDEINPVEEPDAQADGDDDPLGRLVRRAAAILDRWPGDSQPVTR